MIRFLLCEYDMTVATRQVITKAVFVFESQAISTILQMKHKILMVFLVPSHCFEPEKLKKVGN